VTAAGPEGTDREPPPPVEELLERRFLVRVASLPEDARMLLLLAAAEPSGEPALVWRAAAALGIDAEAAAAAEAQGLLAAGPKLRPRHPLVRSAIYQAASLAERRRAHQALAEACDPQLDADRRAWHRAQAALGPDEQVARELEQAAERARARSGHAAQAALLARAAELSPDPVRRAERALEAAAAELAGGRAQAAAALVAGAAGAPLPPLGRARALALTGALERALGSEQAAQTLLAAAAALAEPDPPAARRAMGEALEAALAAGRPDQLARVARAAAAAGAPGPPADAPAALLCGLGALYGGRPQAAAGELRRALSALEAAEEPQLEALALQAAAELGELEALDGLSRRRLARARRQLDPQLLCEALLVRAERVELARGRLGAAELAAAEARALAEAAARPELAVGVQALELRIACWRGREAAARALLGAAAGDAGQGALCLLELGLGRYQAALAAARRALPPDPAPCPGPALCDLVEAAVRAGRPEEAAGALARLRARASALGGDLALGLCERAGALAGAPQDAEAHHRQAIFRLARAGFVAERARAHLLYGEWLRRQRRRRQAREELRAAQEAFSAIGAEAFLARAERELAATGERARRERAEAPSPLTAQEAAIARLVCEGASNPEIAARLFISRRTVEYHLSKVFNKLGVSSRTQLARVAIEA